MSITRLADVEPGIYALHLQDVDNQNIFRDEFLDALMATLAEAAALPDLKVLIMRGLSDVFAGGADRENLLALADGKVHVKDLIVPERLLEFPMPIIGAAEGHAIGGGLVLLLCCDMAVIAEQSRYGANFMNMGFTPGMGCTTLLPMLCGPFVASEMMLTGKRFKGRELVGRTSINRIVPKADVFETALDIARQIAEKDRGALEYLKAALALPKRHALLEARNREDLMHRLTFGAPGMRQRILDAYGA